MVTIEFPDNTIKQFPKGVTALDIAQTISEGLARNVLAVKINGIVKSPQEILKSNQKLQLELLTWTDEDGRKTMWHSSAHLMAEAIEYFYPTAKFTIGPAIENGFYYDIEFPTNVSFSTEDFEKIEKKMLELAQQKNDFTCTNISQKEAVEFFKKRENEYKIELINELKDGEITFYKQGNFIDLCKGPHIPNTHFIKAVKLLNVAGAYWRGDIKKKQLTRIYGITFPKKKELKKY